MLGGDHDGGAAQHAAVGVIFHGDLALAVGAQPGELAALARLGQAAAELVGHGDGRGHQLGGLVAGIAEHHTLVAGPHQVQGVGVAALLHLIGLVDAHGDVGGLLVDGGHNGAGAVIEAVGRVGVADALHGLPGNGGDVGVVGGGDLAHDHDHAGGGEGLTGHMGGGIAGQDIVQNGVGNLVAYLVGMPLGNGLRGKYAMTHSVVPFLSLVGKSARPPDDGHKKCAPWSNGAHELHPHLSNTAAGFGTLRNTTGCRASSGRSLRHSR